MFGSERFSPVQQKQGAQMAGPGEVLDKFNKLEALVTDIISSTNGTCESAASSAIDSAVRRARQKNKILPSMGSGLVLAALDEVAFDIASLPEVSVANAAIMRQITEDMLHQSIPKTPVQGAAPPSSVRSVRGDQVPPNPESLESAGAGGAGGSGRLSSPESGSELHQSSVFTTIQQPGSGGTNSAMDEELESTAGTDAATTAAAAAVAHRLMDPLRQLNAEIYSAGHHDAEFSVIRRDLRLRKPKSGDLKMAREIDFNTCSSPRPSSSPQRSSSSSPRVGKLGTPRFRGACLEFGLDARGEKPLRVEPLYREIDQYSPMGGGTERGGTGQILTLKGDHPPAPDTQLHPSQQHPNQRQWHSTGAPGSVQSGPGTSFQSLSPRGSGDGGDAKGERVESRGPAFNVCEAGAPPGLLPTARVEGSKESIGGVGIGVGGEKEGEPRWFDAVNLEEGGELGSSMIPKINDVTDTTSNTPQNACSKPVDMCNQCDGDSPDSPGTTNGAGNPRFCRITSGVTLQAALASNRGWAKSMVDKDPNFFTKLASAQAPDWLWIGCSDSRVPANELLGMGPGEVFVQRNVGNLATHKDMNSMSCLEYAVTALKVKHIIVCGHYNCGAVRAALTLPCKTAGLVNLWIQDIREVRNKHEEVLLKLPDIQSRWEKLVELNVIQQVFNVCTSPVVQQAWDDGQPLAIHGLVYSLEDGLLKEITPPITCLEDVDHYSDETLHRKSMDTIDGKKNTQAEDMMRLSQSLTSHMVFEKQAA